MKFNLDIVPRDLDEAVKIIKEAIQKDEEKEWLKDTVGLHFGLGMYLRNNWSLWDKDTVLVQWFKKNLDIDHADDISGTILAALAANLTGQVFVPKSHVQKYIEHWKKFKIIEIRDPK